MRDAERLSLRAFSSGTEDSDLSVLAAERLESLESSLPVVETCRGDGHGDGVFIHQDAGVPLAVFIRARICDLTGM